MFVDFKNSQTKDNLMRAFAGESQARNRYTFAAGQAKQQKLQVLAEIFTFTANQEKEHAEIFYNFLKDLSGETITVDGTYPVDIDPSIQKILRCAEHNELEEHDVVYKSFAEIAKEEGFPQIASAFELIARIEKTHANRFGRYAQWMEQDLLFGVNDPLNAGCAQTDGDAVLTLGIQGELCVESNNAVDFCQGNVQSLRNHLLYLHRKIPVNVLCLVQNRNRRTFLTLMGFDDCF